jgi:hypothetical protein
MTLSRANPLLLAHAAVADNVPRMETTNAATRFGEVVEASVERLMGQCHRLYEAPALGTLVRAGDDIYGIVSGIATTALDPTRRVIARGADAETEADVYVEHPQLERLLRTDVAITVVGHGEGGGTHQYLPSFPPRIHTFLYTCAADEVRAFMSEGAAARLDFVGLLVGWQPTGDDVLAAVLRQAAQAFDAPRDFLLAASRAVASLMANDTARINAVLRRLPMGDGR